MFSKLLDNPKVFFLNIFIYTENDTESHRNIKDMNLQSQNTQNQKHFNLLSFQKRNPYFQILEKCFCTQPFTAQPFAKPIDDTNTLLSQKHIRKAICAACVRQASACGRAYFCECFCERPLRNAARNIKNIQYFLKYIYIYIYMYVYI